MRHGIVRGSSRAFSKVSLRCPHGHWRVYTRAKQREERSIARGQAKQTIASVNKATRAILRTEQLQLQQSVMSRRIETFVTTRDKPG